MKLLLIIEYLRQHLTTTLNIFYAVLVALIVLDALPFVVDKAHAHTVVEHWPAFWAIFGLLGCELLVLASKTLGHIFVYRHEGYYDE